MFKTARSRRRLAAILGMFLGILLWGQASQAAVHVVTLLANNTFSPNDITIQLGDRVDWVWTSTLHTVTNGTGFMDHNAGTLFDAPLDNVNTVVSQYFTSVGDVPYFCRPHEIFNMKGIVRVEAGAAVPMLPAGPGLLLAALLAASIPWMRKLLRGRAAVS